MQPKRRHPAFGYSVAVVAVLATVLVDAAVVSLAGERAPIIALLLPVIVAAVYGGVGPGLAATALCTAFALGAIYSPPLAYADVWRAGLFVTEGALASWLVGSRGRAMRAETEALRDRDRSEAEYRELVQNVNSVILRWRHDGTVTFVNAHAEAVFGYRAEELIGRHVGIIVPGQESSGRDLRDLVEDVVAHPERYRENVNENVSRDGRRIWMLWTNRPVLDERGNVSEILAIGSDITELKEAEEALRDADRRKSEFLAVLGHELRNPLAPLYSGLELLKTGNAAGRRDEVLDMMQRQLSYLVHLVDDLLDLSRISRGRLQLRLADLDFRDVIDTAIETARPKIRDRGHELLFERPARAIPVHGDFHRLSQVLANLLNNAAKYTDDGGRISVDVDTEEGSLVVSVRDSGFGIPAEHLEQVFEMFSQIPEHRKRTGGGDLGIGLAVSRQLIALHGGSLHAESEGPGSGSRLVLRLPLRARNAARDERSVPSPELAGARRVLVVDDNVDAAESLSLLLASAGHHVELAHDGAAALDSLERSLPDAVVLDIGLPGVDGYELARRIRRMPGGGSVRLLALTGWGQPEDRRRAWEAGFDEHLTKPVDFSVLATLIGAHAAAGRGMSRAPEL